MTWWEWVAEFGRRTAEAGDAERARLVSLLRQASAAREHDPELALALCEQGRHLAERLQEPWWTLCFRGQVLQELVHYLRDFGRACDLAVELTLAVRKSAYNGCPLRTSVYQDLLAVFFGTDPEGHSEQIEAGFRQLEIMIPTDLSSRLHLLNLRRWCAEQSRRPQEHFDAAQRVLALAAEAPDHFSSPHYCSFAFNGLCHVNFSSGHWPDLDEAARLADEASQKSGNRVERAVALLWQALGSFHRGDSSLGHRLRQRGVRLMARLMVPPPDAYFSALSLCHEHQGQVHEALAVRESELTHLRSQGRTISEVYCHRERCRLLAGLGRLTSSDLNAARAAARRLRRPECHLDEFDTMGSR
jgi:hypothetical protein